MKLSKQQREQVRLRYGGRCAYCGNELGVKWHADHMEPVHREHQYIRGKGYVATGEMQRPHNDVIENMMPACIACNIDKFNLSLEEWRHRLQNLVGVLTRNHSAYRHALRFGLVKETGIVITFYFESISRQADAGCK